MGGIDAHADTHHAAVVLMIGGRITDAQFPATSDGYAALPTWMQGFGRLRAVGIEGTASYGAGPTSHLRRGDISVVEANPPDRRQRRTHGKSDPLDAAAAVANAVLADRAHALPNGSSGTTEAIRPSRPANPIRRLARELYKALTSPNITPTNSTHFHCPVAALRRERWSTTCG